MSSNNDMLTLGLVAVAGIAAIWFFTGGLTGVQGGRGWWVNTGNPTFPVQGGRGWWESDFFPIADAPCPYCNETPEAVSAYGLGK